MWLIHSQNFMVSIFRKSLLKQLALLLGGVLLFTQLFLSAQACMLPAPEPARAFGDAMATEGCDGVPMEQTTCLAHCLSADQIASTPQDVHFHAISPPVSPVVTLSALRQIDLSAPSWPVARSTDGPPLQILFCSFQI